MYDLPIALQLYTIQYTGQNDSYTIQSNTKSYIHMASSQKTQLIQLRVNQTLKDDVGNILEHLGLTIPQAITMFLKQVKNNRGIPFPLKVDEEVEWLSEEEEKDVVLAMEQYKKGEYSVYDPKDPNRIKKLLD
jgi:addiction module RelB/DinJ family antitoxin